jgi:hypothetical protein
MDTSGSLGESITNSVQRFVKHLVTFNSQMTAFAGGWRPETSG